MAIVISNVLGNNFPNDKPAKTTYIKSLQKYMSLEIIVAFNTLYRLCEFTKHSCPNTVFSGRFSTNFTGKVVDAVKIIKRSIHQKYLAESYLF